MNLSTPIGVVMKKKVFFAAVVLAVVIAVAAYLFLKPSEDYGSGIRVSGNIEVTTVDLSFRIAGRVHRRFVDEGEVVAVGQRIAQLERDDLEHEVAARKAEVQAATAALAELEAGYRREEIAQGTAALQKIQAEADRLKADYARQQVLYKKEVISRRDFDAAKAAHEAAQAGVREAGEKLALLRKGPRKETIDQARARLLDTEAVLALAETRLGYSELVSPARGLVLSKNIEPGEQVAAGTPVVTVGLMDNVWLRAYISETDLGRVKVGQGASVTTDTWPGRKYRGRISFISSEAEFTPKTVQTEKERVKLVYRIKIDIPNPNMELKPGMPADARIELQKPGTGHKAQGARLES